MQQHKSRLFQTLIYSGVGIAAMLVLLIVVNFVVDSFPGRIDATENNIYTLSEGTEKILSDIENPITVRFYFSRDAENMPMRLKNYGKRVEDLLKEYREKANGKITIKKFNPKPLSDAADTAKMDGITGRQVGMGGRKIYLGLSISRLDSQQAIPFLDPTKAQSLEYDITRAIYRILHPEKKVLGVLSSLPVTGSSQRSIMGQQGTKAWHVINDLKQDYEIRKVDKKTDKIPSEIDVLLVIHPVKLSPQTVFALDQYVLGGGSMMALVDPLATVAMQGQSRMEMMRSMQRASSSLGKLFDAWGIDYNKENVMVDMQYATEAGARGGQTQVMPGLLTLPKGALSNEDPVTAALDTMMMMFAGSFSGTGADGLNRTVLVSTSPDSQSVPKLEARRGMQRLKENFKPSEERQPLAIRLTGEFETAFPDGKPDAPEMGNKGKDGNNDESSQDDKEKENSKEKKDKTYLEKSDKEGAVVLVSDVDVASDRLSVQTQNLFGQQIQREISENTTFIHNVIDQLAGGSKLMSIRSRGVQRRPFKKINKMRSEARQEYQDRISELQQELNSVEKKLRQLQQGREASGDQQLILSPEQEEAMQRYQKKEAETRKELKRVRKQLREDIVSLENKLKFANIILMPALVCIAGIIVAVIKRRRAKR